MLALRKDGGGILVYRLNGASPEGVPLQGAEASEYPVRFADDGKSLLVANSNGQELVVTLIDLANGHRTHRLGDRSQHHATPIAALRLEFGAGRTELIPDSREFRRR